MKSTAKLQRILFLLLLVISLPAVAQNQAELNNEAHNSYMKANNEMNRIYQQIKKEYKSDTIFIKNLYASQKIWLKFRQAQLAMKYPEYPSDAYGSCQPMCVSNYLTDQTRDRIRTLKVWIDGIKQGEVCSGSVKVIE
jgi:uncharacterized protein YecT (DUF1311 family)